MKKDQNPQRAVSLLNRMMLYPIKTGEYIEAKTLKQEPIGPIKGSLLKTKSPITLDILLLIAVAGCTNGNLKSRSIESQTQLCINQDVHTGSSTCQAESSGSVQGIRLIENTFNIVGWSCTENDQAPLAIEIYAGNPNSGGRIIKKVISDRNEPANSINSCGSDSMAYFFTAPLSLSEIESHQKKRKIFVFAQYMNEGDKKKIALPNSGVFSLPLFSQILPPESPSSQSSDAPSTPQIPNSVKPGKIYGHIDGIPDVNGNKMITGWACQNNFSQPISVHVYIADLDGKRTELIKGANANMSSENAINSHCKSALSYHRFRIPISSSEMLLHLGKSIFVYGVNPSDGSTISRLLEGSGLYKLTNGQNPTPAPSATPELPPSPAPKLDHSGDIFGHIDGVSGSVGNYRITGWACQKKLNKSINVHAYISNSAGGRTVFKGAIADLISENAIRSSCDNSFKHHRFSIPISSSDISSHGGKAISIHGISTSGIGSKNLLLSNSGLFKIPFPTQPTPLPGPSPNLDHSGDVFGHIDSVSGTNGSYRIEGWACQKKLNKSIDIHAYVGSSDGERYFLKGATGNLASEIAINTICNNSYRYHRFNIPILPSEVAAHGGKTISIHGISTSGIGSKNLLLTNSGLFKVPFSTQANQGESLLLSSLTIIAGQNLEIPFGKTVTVDRSIDVAHLIIRGALTCSNSAVSNTYNLTAKAISIHGKLNCGSQENRYSGKLNIRLRGGLAPSGMGERGVFVHKGGETNLFGKLKSPVWHKIETTAQIGQNHFNFNTAVNWKIGDDVVVTSSNFSMNEAERGTITSISSDKRRVTINRTLKYRHWGDRKNYIKNGRSWVLDERSIVANLSRNIKISPYGGSFESSELGAHMMVMAGGKAHIDSVEFSKMGRKGEMARYPFHWHRVGNANGQYIKNSSIHDSYQRCVTIHATNYAKVENNVCYNHFGHGFFLEDGSESNNILNKNLGLSSKIVAKSKSLLISDVQGVASRFPATSTFWISNPNNTVINNVAAGSSGTGFWMAFEAIKKCNKDYCSDKFVLNENTLRFDNNVAHSNKVGITWDGGPNGVSTNNPNNPGDKAIESTHYSPKYKPIFNNLVAYKNREAGIYFRGDAAQFNNAILADNIWSLFLAYSQHFKNSIIVGKSSNFSVTDGPHYKESAGVIIYDGPFEMENVHFFDFPVEKEAIGQRIFENVPFATIGGANRFVNKVSGLTFTPEPRIRIKFIDPNQNWFDSPFSSAIKDIDGSLTGMPGNLVVPHHPFNDHFSCVDLTEWGSMICDYEVGLFYFSRSTDPIRMNYKVTSPSGKTTTSDPNERKSQYQNKFNAILGSSGFYQVEPGRNFLSPSNKLLIRFQAEGRSVLSPVLKISYKDCTISEIPEVSSKITLQNSSGSGYYRGADGTYLRLVTNVEFNQNKQSAFSRSFYQLVQLQCS